MFKSRGIKITHPKPYERVGLSFILSGWISKSWLESKFGTNYQINLHFLNARGSPFLGASFPINPPKSWLQRLLGRVPFYQITGLSEANIHFTKKSQGRIAVKLSGHNAGQEIYIPIIVNELEPEGGTDSKTIEMHGTISERVNQYKVDLEKWGAELDELRKRREEDFQKAIDEDKDMEGGIEIQDRSLLVDIYHILNHAEDEEKSAIDEKYKDALEWSGPWAGETIGSLNGFKFVVYSDDHNPKHFHAIHRGRGVNARFSYPDIQLINYKNFRNTINSRERDNICNFFKNPENFKKLKAGFHKQIS